MNGAQMYANIHTNQIIVPRYTLHHDQEPLSIAAQQALTTASRRVSFFDSTVYPELARNLAKAHGFKFLVFWSRLSRLHANPCTDDLKSNEAQLIEQSIVSCPVMYRPPIAGCGTHCRCRRIENMQK
jgi:hypothetical protein